MLGNVGVNVREVGTVPSEGRTAVVIKLRNVQILCSGGSLLVIRPPQSSPDTKGKHRRASRSSVPGENELGANLKLVEHPWWSSTRVSHRTCVPMWDSVQGRVGVFEPLLC